MDRFIARCLLLGLAHGCRRDAAAAAPAHVTAPTDRLATVAVTAERAVREVLLRGVVAIAPGKHALVAPQVAGRLLAVEKREGDPVHRGDVLARVESRPAADALTQTRAALAGAVSAASNAEIAAGRTQALFDHGISSRREVEDAQARLTAARAQVTAARAVTDLAARNVALSTVRSPIDGVVLRTLRAAGDLVDGTPATGVVEVGDTTDLEMLASAAPADLVRLRAGQTAATRFGAIPGRTYVATVRAIAPVIDSTTGVGAVRLALTSTDGAPPIGLTGDVAVTVGTDEAVRFVPATALRTTASGETEVLACEGGRTRAKTVRLGERHDARVEVLDGVAAGERVVTSGVLGVEDGADCRDDAR